MYIYTFKISKVNMMVLKNYNLIKLKQSIIIMIAHVCIKCINVSITCSSDGMDDDCRFADEFLNF